MSAPTPMPKFPLVTDPTPKPPKPPRAFQLIGPATVKYPTPPGAKKAPLITDLSTNTLLKDLTFDIGSRCVVVEAHPGSQGLNMTNVQIKNGSLLDCELGGVQNATVTGGGNLTHATDAFGLIYLGGRDPLNPNRNITLRGLTSQGSTSEHCLRVHQTQDLLVEDCQFRNPPLLNPAKSGRATYNLRDGSHFTIRGTHLAQNTSKTTPPNPTDPASHPITIENQVILGPLADRDGGQDDILYAEQTIPPPKRTHPQPFTQAERDRFRAEHIRKMALTLDGVLFENFYTPANTGAYWILEAGLSNVTIANGVFTVRGGGGYAFSFQKQYGPWKGSPLFKPRPTNITLRNVWVTLPKNGKFFGGRAINLNVENCWYRFEDPANPNPAYLPVTPKMVKYATAP